jgi:hypothetical protein
MEPVFRLGAVQQSPGNGESLHRLGRPDAVDSVDNHNRHETAPVMPRSASIKNPHRLRTENMTLHFLPPVSDAYDAAVDAAIATCDGDIRGALKALIIANEFLERDLEKALSSCAAPSIAHDGSAAVRHVYWLESAEG